MKSAAGKRPPDEAHGPGKEAIRPLHRSKLNILARSHRTISDSVFAISIPTTALLSEWWCLLHACFSVFSVHAFQLRLSMRSRAQVGAEPAALFAAPAAFPVLPTSAGLKS